MTRPMTRRRRRDGGLTVNQDMPPRSAGRSPDRPGVRCHAAPRDTLEGEAASRQASVGRGNPRFPLRGLTFIELMSGAAILAIAIVALLAAFMGQAVMNEHARNLAWAMNDANRVMERIRELNTGCGAPTTTPPPECGGVCASWDTWLASATGGGGRSLPAAAGEALAVSATGGPDPLTVTVAVCWTHRGRAIGNCAAPPTSPAILNTVITCR